MPQALARPDRLFADASPRGGKPAVDPGWSAVTDRVMGGVSDVAVAHERVDGRHAWRMRGEVRLENNGGFVQLRAPVEVSVTDRAGLWLDLRGNDESYVVSLRTDDIRRPWQSYRAEVRVPAKWTRVELPWEAFQPYRIEVPLDISTLRSVHLLGVGRAFTADLAVSAVGWL